MPVSPHLATLLLTLLLLSATSAAGQQVQDSSAKYPWRKRVHYGGGPSVGTPPSDFAGKSSPLQWCLTATRRAPGDLGASGQSWMDASRSWLRYVLSDTTALGKGWRGVLGGAPVLTPNDTIVQVVDELACRDIAEVINRGLLGWEAGPPPVVVFRVRDYLIAYPSNAPMGEFGLAVGMSLTHEIRGVAMW